MKRETFDWTWREFIRFTFRPRAFEGKLLVSSFALLFIIFGSNWAFRAVQGNTRLELSSTNVIPECVQYSVAILCVVGIMFSAWMAWTRFQRENAAIKRKKVLVVEGRGLQADNGAPLVAAIPDWIGGNRIPIGLNLRQGKDGVLHDPQALLLEIDAARRNVQQNAENCNREDLTIVYGGLTPVPFTFLTGLLLDDEGTIVTMDWDRTNERWRSLDADDDGVRFEINGLDSIGGSTEVVLAVSVSYPVLLENISTTFQLPIVTMNLPDLTSSHWSQVKQSALAEQLLNVAKSLEGKGIRIIHLILAAQNSVVFNMGRRYDRKNLPEVIVYQFERGQERKYPWGVRMPVSGRRTPEMAHPHP